MMLLNIDYECAYFSLNHFISIFKFWLLFVCKIVKKLSASGGLRPPDPTRGSAPGPRWGLCPQTPLIGSRSALAMACPPTFKHLPRSMVESPIASCIPWDDDVQKGSSNRQRFLSSTRPCCQLWFPAVRSVSDRIDKPARKLFPPHALFSANEIGRQLRFAWYAAMLFK